MPGSVVVLAGGVGGARFLEGLAAVLPPSEITVIGNTADDTEIHGLHISPDLDTVTYTLAGLADPVQGWGVNGDTFHCLDFLGHFTSETWFRLGDRDLATHIYRTALLRDGVPLSEVTSHITRALRVESRILPMSDHAVRTWVITPEGRLDFQTYFVKHQAQDEVRAIEFAGAENSKPAPGVCQAIREAKAVIIAPSNPLISIGPILAVPGIQDALQATEAPVAAITPIVEGRALKGPTARMMQGVGLEVSTAAIAELYQDLLDVYVLDQKDAILSSRVEKLGVRAVPANTIMSSLAQKKDLARAALEAAGL